MGAQVGRIRSALGLGETEAADGFAARHGRQPSLALLLAAVLVDGEHAQRALHGIEAADGAVAAFQFLRDQPAGHGTQAGAAVAFSCAPNTPSAASCGISSRGKRCCSKHSRMTGQHLVVDEARDAVAHGHIFSGQLRCEIEEIQPVGSVHAGMIAHARDTRQSRSRG